MVPPTNPTLVVSGAEMQSEHVDEVIENATVIMEISEGVDVNYAGLLVVNFEEVSNRIVEREEFFTELPVQELLPVSYIQDEEILAFPVANLFKTPVVKQESSTN